MTRIETLKLMGFSHEEAIEKATEEATAREAFRNTKVTSTERRIVVVPDNYSGPLNPVSF